MIPLFRCLKDLAFYPKFVYHVQGCLLQAVPSIPENGRFGKPKDEVSDMYEELYASIPDPDAYLARVGLTRPAQPDLDFLNRLVYAHQQPVIF